MVKWIQWELKGHINFYVVWEVSREDWKRIMTESLCRQLKCSINRAMHLLLSKREKNQHETSSPLAQKDFKNPNDFQLQWIKWFCEIAFTLYSPMPSGKTWSKFWETSKSVKEVRPLISSGRHSNLFSETSRQSRFFRFPTSCDTRKKI